MNLDHKVTCILFPASHFADVDAMFESLLLEAHGVYLNLKICQAAKLSIEYKF